MDRGVPPLDDNGLRIRLENHKPVELKHLADMMQAMSSEYSSYLTRQDDYDLNRSNAKLFLQRVTEGSIIMDLVALAPATPAVVEAVGNATQIARTVSDFGEYLAKGYKYLKGDVEEQPEGLKRKNYENLGTILEPVTQNSSNSINIENTQGNVFVNINGVEANASQNRANKIIDEFDREKIDRRHSSQLLTLVETSRSSKMKGIIEELHPKALSITCQNDEIKDAMIKGAHPYNSDFIVDVDLKLKNGKPYIYHVMKVIDTVENEEEEA